MLASDQALAFCCAEELSCPRPREAAGCSPQRCAAMPVCEEIDGEDEEIVMTVLGSLEDLLYEPISIGGGDSSDSSDDDAWNSCESKEGHSLRDEIATFADRAIAADDDAGEGEYPLV